MKEFFESLLKFHEDEEGQGMTEYIIIVVVIAIVVIGAAIAFRRQIVSLFESAEDDLAVDNLKEK